MFVDSSYWIGLVDSRGQWHKRALELRAQMPDGASVLDLTAAEAITIVGSRRGGREARDLYDFFRDSCRLWCLDEELLEASVQLHLARDGRLSLTDCATIQAMIRNGEKTVVSFDSDLDSIPGIVRLH